MDSIVLAGAGVVILVGLAGIFVPWLPGVGLIWAAVLVWASIENTGTAWVVLGAATILALGNYIAQHLLAGRELRELVAPMRSLVLAAALGAAGYLLARTLGLIAGFALGLYLAERRRLRRQGSVRPDHRLRPRIGRESAIELLAGLLVTAAWLVAVSG